VSELGCRLPAAICFQRLLSKIQKPSGLLRDVPSSSFLPSAVTKRETLGPPRALF
jgi:hypothetical protein